MDKTINNFNDIQYLKPTVPAATAAVVAASPSSALSSDDENFQECNSSVSPSSLIETFSASPCPSPSSSSIFLQTDEEQREILTTQPNSTYFAENLNQTVEMEDLTETQANQMHNRTIEMDMTFMPDEQYITSSADTIKIDCFDDKTAQKINQIMDETFDQEFVNNNKSHSQENITINSTKIDTLGNIENICEGSNATISVNQNRSINDNDNSFVSVNNESFAFVETISTNKSSIINNNNSNENNVSSESVVNVSIIENKQPNNNLINDDKLLNNVEEILPTPVVDEKGSHIIESVLSVNNEVKSVTNLTKSFGETASLTLDVVNEQNDLNSTLATINQTIPNINNNNNNNQSKVSIEQKNVIEKDCFNITTNNNNEINKNINENNNQSFVCNVNESIESNDNIEKIVKSIENLSVSGVNPDLPIIESDLALPSKQIEENIKESNIPSELPSVTQSEQNDTVVVPTEFDSNSIKINENNQDISGDNIEAKTILSEDTNNPALNKIDNEIIKETIENCVDSHIQPTDTTISITPPSPLQSTTKTETEINDDKSEKLQSLTPSLSQNFDLTEMMLSVTPSPTITPTPSPQPPPSPSLPSESPSKSPINATIDHIKQIEEQPRRSSLTIRQDLFKPITNELNTMRNDQQFENIIPDTTHNTRDCFNKENFPFKTPFAASSSSSLSSFPLSTNESPNEFIAPSVNNAGQFHVADDEFQGNNMILNQCDFDELLSRNNGSSIPIAAILSGRANAPPRESVLQRFDPLRRDSLKQELLDDNLKNLTNRQILNDFFVVEEKPPSQQLLPQQNQTTYTPTIDNIRQNNNLIEFTPPTPPTSSTVYGKMSVGLIPEFHHQDNDDKSDIQKIEIERTMLTELMKKAEVMEKKINDLETREEALIKRITEKDKTITKMSHCMEEYEKVIAELTSEKEEIKKNQDAKMNEIKNDRDVNARHLTSLETTFSDLHLKYERCKETTNKMLDYETNLQKEKEQLENLLGCQEQRYDKMKSHALQQLEMANMKIETLTRNQTVELTKLKAQLKKEEISRQSAFEQLVQKTKENEELVKICDELINGQGS